MEIKVGEYVRYDDGSIVKVVEEEVSFFNYVLENKGIMSNGIYKTIVKHSKNIIDLIEVGDMVHTRDVLNEHYCYMYDESFIRAIKEDITNGIELIDILTHEQFEQNAYRLEEK